MRDLLFEIGTEEIPAGYLQPAYQQLKENFSKKARELNLDFGTVRVMGTPRRIALIVEELQEKQKDVREELLGPSRKAAYDAEGRLSKAAEGFARSKGADVSDLQVVDTPRGEYMMLVREVKGKATSELLPGILEFLVRSLSFPKSMRWGSRRIHFARPIQWFAALYGEEVITFEYGGIVSSNQSGGHRFLNNTMFTIRNAAAYEAQLAEMNVIVDDGKRREKVITEITEAVARNNALAGGQVAIDEGLVATVTNLVENPVGVCGSFDEKFLQLVPEVLITSMREHQKYFPVVDDKGALMPGFVAVNNTIVNDSDITRKGHQRVLRARLEDALFFFDSDRQVSLSSRIADLDGIIFQTKLGTMSEKKDRIVKLVKVLSEKINPELSQKAIRAAELCKADLLSDMVGEFPSLQGVMGAAYALNDGEDEDVAQAIREHYMPKRAGAELPASDLGAILGLADRFDTLAGCFGIGQIPSGNTDPFGLRRIALAIIHIIEEKEYRFSLAEIISKALALYGDRVNAAAETVDSVVTFIKGRFANDAVKQGRSARAVEAAASVAFDEINDCIMRVDALMKIRNNESFSVLSASYKRIRNIIKDNRDTHVDTAIFCEEEEKVLYGVYKDIRAEVEDFVSSGNYYQALETMLKMEGPVDNFFENVMVMADDKAVKTNRLNLLTALGELILMVGDISRFQDA